MGRTLRQFYRHYNVPITVGFQIDLYINCIESHHIEEFPSSIADDCVYEKREMCPQN